jgi:hypothetical protein
MSIFEPPKATTTLAFVVVQLPSATLLDIHIWNITLPPLSTCYLLFYRTLVVSSGTPVSFTEFEIAERLIY